LEMNRLPFGPHNREQRTLTLMRMRLFAHAAIVLLLLAMSGLAAAHHSYAQFDMSQFVLIEGRITAWHLDNPHSYMLVEAVEKYQLVIVEGVAPGSPSSWHNAHAEARVELEALRPRLAWLTLVVSGAEKRAITIDRIRFPDAALGVPRAMNPGKHEIRVRAAGYLPEVRSVTLSEGGKERVEIALVPRPRDTDGAAPHDADAATPPDAPATRSYDSPVAEPQASPDSPAAPPKSGDSGTRRGLAYAAFASGGVGLVFGGVTGAMALHRRSELQSQCSGGVCPASESDEIDAYHRLGVASGIGFGIAALGIGTGITLLLTESDERPSDDGPKRSRGVSPFVGLGTIGVTGRY